MKISKNVILTFVAILGTVLSFFIVDMFIVPITIGRYLAIEIVISSLHYMYNKVKIQTFNN
jgi:hypothetical protein